MKFLKIFISGQGQYMLKKRTLIAIVGMAGAGKSSTAAFFKQKGFTILRFGDQTDIGLQEMGLALTEKNERKYREHLRHELGMAAYAIKIKPRIETALKSRNKIALDGLYSWEEYLYLKKEFSDLILLCIYTNIDIRYARLQSRNIRSLTKKQARDRDIAELVNLNKGNPIALSDYLVQNNGTETQLHHNLEIFLKLLK
jgi:dephospho-CoA kinase